MLCLDLLSRVRSVLLLGAHSDDIEIGCGGTVLRLLDVNPDVKLTWCVFSGNEQRHAEAFAAAGLFAPAADVRLFHFRDGLFPQEHRDIKQQFERLKGVDPDLILTHSRDDRHQDHRTLAELTWNTFRSHLILQYEIPKWDGDLSRPNAYVRLDPQHLDGKLQHLESAFGTQRGKHWFDGETFRGLARLRGMECNAKYAEAFHAAKLSL